MLLLIDNYDSFTFNLFHFLGDLGAETEVVRNDAISVEDALARRPDAIVLSPGPCDPDRAGICLDLIAAAAEARLPLLGVCLGHQAIGAAFGGRIVHARQLMHGKTSPVHHADTGVFSGLPSPFTATRYHSLAIERETLPACLEVTAWTEDGEIMGVRHREFAAHCRLEGVQFHPESVRSEHGHRLLRNFLQG